MNLENATVLITGANRGLGREFARQSLDGGAAKVYASARNPDSIDLPGVQPLRLDVTDPTQVAAAAAVADDVDLLINNAGIATMQQLITGDLELIRSELDVHLWGTLAMSRAFAPVLARRGGGAILTVMSTLSFRVYPGNEAYGVAKTAQWALTNAIRLELAAQGTQVTGLHLSATDTDMMARSGIKIPMNDPADVVRDAFEGLRRGDLEVLADEDTREAKRQLVDDPAAVYASLLGTAPDRAAS